MKEDITHLAVEIDIQSTDHVLALEKVAEQCISTKCSFCNSFQVISDFITDGSEKSESRYY